jgi:hypothetical protein
MLGRGRIMTMARRRHTPEQVIPKLREAEWLKRIVADQERAVGTRELRRRGRPVPSARSRSGLAAVGEDIKLTRPGKSHPSFMLPGR